MTAEDGLKVGEAAAGEAEPLDPTITAEEFLEPRLLGLVETIRVASQRVMAGGGQRAAHEGEGAEASRSPEEAGTSAGEAVDTDAVHDFRVALRRLRTLLQPARRVYGKEPMRAISEGLRAYASAAGVVRDEEVLRETLTALPIEGHVRAVLDGWIRQRGSEERACREAVVQLLQHGPSPAGSTGEPHGSAARTPRRFGDSDAPPAAEAMEPPELESCLEQLVDQLSRPKRKGLVAMELGRAAIEGALADVQELAACDPADSAAMHELRIRFKRLRYSAEAFAPLLGERAARTIRAAALMQRHLGQLHDVDEAMLRIKRTSELSPAERAAVVEALAAQRASLMAAAAADLQQELEMLAADWPAVTEAPPA